MYIYKLVSTAVNPEVNVKVSSDAEKGKVSEAVTPERASPVHKHSQQFSPAWPKIISYKIIKKESICRSGAAANFFP
jgi:hypothetical protein